MKMVSLARRLPLGALALLTTALGCGPGEEASPTPTQSEDFAYAADLYDGFAAGDAFLSWSTVPAGLSNPEDIYLSNTHTGAYVLSYANEIAAASLSDWTGAVADGGVLVKAQYADAEGQTLQGFTVMAKRQGYDGDHGDWFWASMTAGGEIHNAGVLSNCLACHGGSADDFILTEF